MGKPACPWANHFALFYFAFPSKASDLDIRNHADDGAIGTHCVPYRKCLVKRAHMPQVAFIKPLAEFRRQPFSQSRQELYAIMRAVYATKASSC